MDRVPLIKKQSDRSVLSSQKKGAPRTEVACVAGNRFVLKKASPLHKGQILRKQRSSETEDNDAIACVENEKQVEECHEAGDSRR